MQTRKIVLAALTVAAGIVLTVPARAADTAEGEKIFKRVCGACHINTADGPKRLGPTLFGVIGRHSSSVEGFRYSEANKKANVTWTPDVLDKYLADPRAMVPGTTMAFAGLKKPEERQDIIAYLQTLK
jgi:cytochrome c